MDRCSISHSLRGTRGPHTPHRPIHQFPHCLQLSLSSLEMIQRLSPPRAFSLLLSSLSTLPNTEVSGMQVRDGDEEAESPADHCEFRQAKDVLPHLPLYHSLTRNPVFNSSIPNTSDSGRRDCQRTCHSHCCSPHFYFFIITIFNCFIFFLLYQPFFCLPGLLFSIPPLFLHFLAPSLFWSHSHYLSFAFPSFPSSLISLSSQQLLLCQNGAKFNTSVDGEEKAAPCHLPHSLVFKIKFSGGLGVPQITFSRT